MHKSSPAFIAFLITSITLASIAMMQLPITSVAADGIPSPNKGVTYTWNVLATNGPVSWFYYNFSYLGTKTITVGGTIQYNLTGNYVNNQAYSSISGNVWYGNFSIFHNVTTTQVWNWTRFNCSSTEIGSDLALSVSGWQGGLIAQTNWVQNFANISSQPSDYINTVQSNGLAVIDYSYFGQFTHLEYELGNGVLTYARTSFAGYNLEISLAGLSTAYPIARIGYNASTLKINNAVQFWDWSYAGSHAFTYQWSFGDGSVNSTTMNPVHMYSAIGTYKVNLTITDKLSRVNKTSITIVIQAIAPSAPQNLQAIGGSGQVVLTWQAPTFDGGMPITIYKIYRGTSVAGLVYLASVSSVLNFTDRNATNGQIYYYQVSAVNAIGEGARSAMTSATPSATIPGYDAVIVGCIVAIIGIAIPVLSKKKFHH